MIIHGLNLILLIGIGIHLALRPSRFTEVSHMNDGAGILDKSV